MHLRGFISAPLLGTLVFLGAVLFVVHVTQMERAEVSGIVADIYHNRVTSMLEDYRYDMGSLFAVALSRAIERYLSGECWEAFSLKNDNYAVLGGDADGRATRGVPPAGFPQTGRFDYNYDDFPFCNNGGSGAPLTCSSRNLKFNSPNYNPTSPDDYLCAENCNGQLDYYELRYKKCAEITNIIRDGICPYDNKYGLTAWLNATRSPFNFEGVGFSVINPELVSTYIDQISCTFTGVGTVTDVNMIEYGPGSETGECKGRSTCKVGNGPNAQPCNGLIGTLSVAEGIKNCRQLVGDSLFDCRNFATNLKDPYQCCNQYSTRTGQCCTRGMGSDGCDGNDHVVPGCSKGSFFVGVNVLASDQVYRTLPRVGATDKGGNEIQGNALGNRNFTIHIKYPVYKYLDAAFKSYMPIAYGICNGRDGSGDFESPINMRLQGGPKCPGGGQPQKNFEGIIEGLCYGLGCGQFNPYSTCSLNNPFRPAYCNSKNFDANDQPFTSEADAREKAKKLFLKTFLDPDPNVKTGVCRLFDPANKLRDGTALCEQFGLCDTKVLIEGMGVRNPNDPKGFYQLCPEIKADGSSDWPAISAGRPNGINFDNLFLYARTDCSPDVPGNQPCAPVEGLDFKIKFVDTLPETLVNPLANNFCWYMRPVHVNPVERAQG